MGDMPSYPMPLGANARRQLFEMWKRRNPRACALLDEYALGMQEREGRVSVQYVIEKLRHDGGLRLEPVPFQDAYGQVHRYGANNSDRALIGRWLARRHDGMRVMTRRSDFDGVD